MTNTPPSSKRIGAFMAWVWAGLLIVGSGLYLAVSTGLLPYSGPLLPPLAGGVALLSLPFAGRWLLNGDEWWAALVAYLFIALAGFLMVVFFKPAYDQLVGIALLVEIAAPLIALYTADRTRWVLLIPAYVLLLAAGLLALTIIGIPLATLGAFALLGAALPLWAAYMVNRMLWWALVPAGLLSLAGVGVLAFVALTESVDAGGFYVILNAALAVVAFALWLTVRRLDWALWLAVGFLLAAALAVWVPSSASFALAALTLGLYIAFKQVDAAYKRKQAVQGGSGASPAHSASPGSSTSTPPPPKPSAGQGASQAAAGTPLPPATPADQARAAADETRGSARRPVVDFQPIDPFRGRDAEGDEGDDGNKDQ